MSGNDPVVPLALALVALGVGVLVVSASLFAAGQAIWLDETTQLLGLTLDFGEQLRWLTGRSDVVLGVPPDRMPPLSYRLGGLWPFVTAVIDVSGTQAADGGDAQSRLRWIATGAAAFGTIARHRGLATLLGNGSLYSHGPGEWVAQAIPVPAETLVIHDGQGLWGHSYFPLFYLSGGETEQWLRAENGDISRITPTGFEPIADPGGRARDFTRIYEIVTRTVTSRSLADIASGAGTCSETFGPMGTEAMIFCAAVSAIIVEIPQVRD